MTPDQEPRHGLRGLFAERFTSGTGCDGLRYHTRRFQPVVHQSLVIVLPNYL